MGWVLSLKVHSGKSFIHYFVLRRQDGGKLPCSLELPYSSKGVVLPLGSLRASNGKITASSTIRTRESFRRSISSRNFSLLGFFETVGLRITGRAICRAHEVTLLGITIWNSLCVAAYIQHHDSIHGVVSTSLANRLGIFSCIATVDCALPKVTTVNPIISSLLFPQFHLLQV